VKEFFINLYNNPSFPIYLGAVIGVLVIAFFVVFFLGKKDKENYDKTQRLEAINANAFKENTVPVQMNVAPQVVTEEQKIQDNNQVIEQPVAAPVVEQPPVIEQPVVAPVVEQPQVVEQPVVAPVVEQPPVIEQPVVAPVIEQPQVVEQPVVEPIPEVEQPEPIQDTTVVYPTLNNYETIDQQVDTQIDNLHNIANSISNELDSLQEEQERYHSMTEPQEVIQPVSMQPTYNQNNVFSSVYAPPKVETVEEDEDEIELPRLK